MITIKLKNYIKKVFLSLIFVFILFICFNSDLKAIQYIQESVINYEGIGKAAVNKDIGKSIIPIAVEAGFTGSNFHGKGSSYTSSQASGTPAYELVYDIPLQGSTFYDLIITNNSNWSMNAKTESGITLISMYNSLYNEMKNLPEYKELFDHIVKTNDSDAKKFAIAIMSEIIIARMNDFYTSYENGCETQTIVQEGKTYERKYVYPKEFKYDGQTYECKDTCIYETITGNTRGIPESRLNCDDIAGFQLFSNVIFTVGISPYGNYIEDYFGEGTNFLQTYYETRLKDDAYSAYDYKPMNRGGKGTVVKRCKDDELFCFGGVEANYYPSIKNIYENSKKLGTKELYSKKNENVTSMLKDVVKEIIEIVAIFGRYIIYAAILFLGVMAIFNGASGKTNFKENIPYLLVAIVFFFKAPDIVDVIQNVFGEINDLENLADSIFKTLAYIAKIAAFCGIIFAGIKIMFGLSSQKAEVSNGLLAIFVGCIFVFCSSLIVDLTVGEFVGNSSTEIKIDYENLGIDRYVQNYI